MTQTMRCKHCGADYYGGRCLYCGSDEFIDVEDLYQPENMTIYQAEERYNSGVSTRTAGLRLI